MHANLEFRGRWLDIFGNTILIAILSTLTLGLYTPWGYARWQRIITENTYYEDQPLEFDGSGGQVFLQFIIIGFFTLITLGLYIILGYSAARLLRWQYAHTLMPNGQRMAFQGEAIDIFWEKFLLFLFTPLTLGIYYFFGYVRLRRQILTNVVLDGQRWRFEGGAGGFFLTALVNWLLSVITLGFYAILGFATVRLLKWEVGQTLVPVPVRSPTPMPVISTPISTLTSGLSTQATDTASGAAASEYGEDFTYQPDASYDYSDQSYSQESYAQESDAGQGSYSYEDQYPADDTGQDAEGTYTGDAYAEYDDFAPAQAAQPDYQSETDQTDDAPNWNDVEPYRPQSTAFGEDTAFGEEEEDEEPNYWRNRPADDET